MPRDEYSAKGFMEGFLSSSTDTEEMKGGCEIPTIHTHNVKYILNQGSKPLNNGKLPKLTGFIITVTSSPKEYFLHLVLYQCQ